MSELTKAARLSHPRRITDRDRRAISRGATYPAPRRMNHGASGSLGFCR